MQQRKNSKSNVTMLQNDLKMCRCGDPGVRVGMVWLNTISYTMDINSNQIQESARVAASGPVGGFRDRKIAVCGEN